MVLPPLASIQLIATNYSALNYSETLRESLRLVYDPEKLSYAKVIET
jgi:hypothetical protein